MTKKSTSRSYRVWLAMLRRCYNRKDYGYENYGGRGITVCSRWRSSFEAFLEDMGERPEGRTLDRKDNDGNYSPENCRWASYEEQAHNRRLLNQTRRATKEGMLSRLDEMRSRLKREGRRMEPHRLAALNAELAVLTEKVRCIA